MPQEKVEEKESVLRTIEGNTYFHTVKEEPITVKNVVADGRKTWIKTHGSYYEREEWQDLRFDGTIEEFEWGEHVHPID